MTPITMRLGALAMALVISTTGCGDDNPGTTPTVDAPEVDAPVTPPTVYRQIEHLARPGIAEALLLSEGFLGGYNATAPTFAGVDATTLGMVVAEAKTVLKAIYLGTCLLNGVAGASPTTGAKPGGLECAAVGGGLFTENNPLTGVNLTTTAQAGAQAYADRVFSQFIPDVMRIDTSIDSAYLTLCDGTAPADAPLLCGGRLLHEDVIDITYFYLIAGASIPTGIPVAQAAALVSDGVQFSATPANNSGNLTAPDATNPNQFHPNVSTTFPYSAPPL